ncbi:MAG: tRNA lysidine(34) synthetase TilS, partial [Acutalibacteraceae bacterium]|nr:tRNA lysidine(34) synthetase TilS [Acutalibacteraceae bacterium]
NTNIVKKLFLAFLTAYSKNLKKTEFFVEIIKKTENVNNLLLNNALDCDKIVGKLVLRTRISGDSIRLANRGCTKTLRKLYNECKIPVDIRDTLPVIADDLGVVWIHTIGVAKRCEVSKKTNSAYIIGVKENE